ncbi:MAG: dihydrofolate reductase [Lachnospiraceae bacterium]|nr:dihydrofolate reductase [Lachnospiraceae bacterium]
MNLIAAADENWGIGCQGKLLVQIPADLKSFREMTMNKVVVMGRKTLESLPNGLPLAGRTNLILTSNPDYRVRNALVLHSVDEVLKEVEHYRSRDVYIIGGESVYRQFLPFCDTVHITKIQEKYEADAFFPNLDEDGEWEITADSEEQTYFDIEYYFLKYERKKVRQ